MDKYKKYYGVFAFSIALVLLVFFIVKLIVPRVNDFSQMKTTYEQKEQELKTQQNKLEIIKKKIKRIKDSIITSQKKVYYPVESDLGNETLFFTLYNDVIEMVHANSVKIQSIDYVHNPEDDVFVKFGKDVYFVCDIKMELVSNYINLGKLIQDIYQYPYYIKINSIEVRPYAKNKKHLISNMSLRLYAHTAPEEINNLDDTSSDSLLDGASSALPQE